MRLIWSTLLGGSVLLMLGQDRMDSPSRQPNQKTSCTHCHTMSSHRASWAKGNHAKAAGCVDCHLPHGPFMRRAKTMAADGLRHAAIEGLHPSPDSLRIRGAGASVVQANCLRCHPRRPPSPADDPTRPKPVPMTSAHADTTQACAQCHRETSHSREGAPHFGLMNPKLSR